MEGITVIKPPLTEETVRSLHIGDPIRITGIVYTARDEAHRRLVECLERGDPLPFDIRGQIVYYAGPAPARPGKPVGSIGPTTACRMDFYTPRLLEAGLKGMIGKGKRSEDVLRAMQRHTAVYLGAIGGAAALMAQRVKKAETVAYADLGPEAVLRLEVEDFPAVVVNDCRGGDLYEEGMKQYRK